MTKVPSWWVQLDPRGSAGETDLKGFAVEGGGEPPRPDREEPDMVSRLSAVDLVGMKQEKQMSHLC